MAIAGAIHLGFFVVESLLWSRPQIHSLLGVRTPDEAEMLRFAMFNQGFYNLFLALGTFVGVAGSWVLWNDRHELLVFCALFMIGAATVLVVGNRRLWRGAALQGGPPAIAMLLAVVV
jgi:putative membrane protein